MKTIQLSNDHQTGAIIPMKKDWHVTQFGRGLLMTDSVGRETLYVPPVTWGDAWGWNLCDQGVMLTRKD
jgi:hypothetical protein